MKKKYTTEFKAMLVQEMLREQKSISQLAAEHGIHPNQLYAWRATALTGLPTLFSDQASQEQAAREQALHQQIDQLYRDLGQATSQLNWLKKKAGGLLDQ
jgi:transposase-like protein